MKKALFIILLFLCSPWYVSAEELAAKRDSSVIRTDGVNAKLYRMMKRYRPADKSIYPLCGSFFSDSYISSSASSFIPFLKDYTWGQVISLSYGKRFSPLHGIRLSAEAVRYYDNFTYSKISEINLTLSYLFNISAYLSGYDETRFCNIFPVAGIAVDILDSTPIFEGRLGLNFNMHLARNLDFFLEPDVFIRPDINATPHSDNWRGYMLGLNTAAGFSYRINNPCPQDYTQNGDWFLFACGGAMMQNSVKSQELKFLQRIGFSSRIGVGRHCTECFDLRTSLSFSNHNWRYSSGVQTLGNRNISLVLDGFFDFVALVAGQRGKRMGFGLSGGMDFGYMDKKYHLPGSNVSHLYAGFHGGLDALFHINERLSLFLEPKYTFVPYSAASSDFSSNSINANYYDGLFDVCLGIVWEI